MQEHSQPQSDLPPPQSKASVAPKKALNALQYGQNLHPAKRPSARDILAIMDSKKNFRGVAKAFDALSEEAAHDVTVARSIVPKPANPYRYLLKLPKAFHAIRFLASRKVWFRKKTAWAVWMTMMQQLWTHDAIRNQASSRIGKWIRHSKARKALMFLQGNTDEDATVDANGNAVKVDPMSAFAKSSVRMLRAQQATIIQCGIRRWLSGFALDRQVYIKDAHVKNKLMTRVQKLFRGYFCRACFCLKEKSLLLKQLRSWAQGSTQKLLVRDDLSDAAHQQLILAGIYTAALPSRPLRSLPTLQQIIVLRSRLLDLQHMVESEHTIMHTLYKNRREERSMMYVADLQSTYYRNFERIQVAQDTAALEKALAERARIQEEELKIKQRKNAMSVMAHYTLDQNNQRVERENMFREEHLTRKYAQSVALKALERVQQDRQAMLRQDYLSGLQRDDLAKSVETKKNLAESAEAVRSARLKAAGVGDFDSISNIFESILPWWSQKDSSQTPEELRVDRIKEVIHTVLGEIVFTSTTNAGQGAEVRAKDENKDHCPNPYPTKITVPSYALLRTASELAEEQVFTCYPTLEEGALKRAALLTDLRAKRKEREQMYTLLMAKKHIFTNMHAQLWNIRNKLLTVKFSTRKAKKECQNGAIAQELLLPLARAEILRHGKALSKSFQRELEAFVAVFVPLGAEQEKYEESNKTFTPKSPAERARARVASNAAVSTRASPGQGEKKTEDQLQKDPPNAEHAASIPLADVTESTRATATPATASTANKHTRWAVKEMGSENAALETLLPAGEQEKRRSYWGFNVSECCRRGLLAGTEENNEFGSATSTTSSPSKAGKVSRHDQDGLLMPPVYPPQKSEHDGYSISRLGSSGRFDKFIPSAFRSKAGASLSETFGLDFSDSDSVSSTGASSVGSKGRKLSVAPIPGSHNTSRSSKRREKEAKAAAEDKAKARAERKPRLVPGFSFYTFEDVTEYDFIQWVQSVQDWCSCIDDWMSNVQEKWRNTHRSVLISILHRVQWLQDCHRQDLSCLHKLEGSTSVSDRGHAAPLSNKFDIINCNPEFETQVYGKSPSQVAKAAADVSRQSVLDLYELYYSRADWQLVLSSGEGLQSRVYKSKISSRQAERLFGFHSFSYTALFFLQNRLSGGTVKMLNVQANTTRANVDSRWTNVAAAVKDEKAKTGAVAKPRRLGLGLKGVVSRVRASNTDTSGNANANTSPLGSPQAAVASQGQPALSPSSAAQKQKNVLKSSSADLPTLIEQEEKGDLLKNKPLLSSTVSRKASPKARGNSISVDVKMPIFIENAGHVSAAALAAGSDASDLFADRLGAVSPDSDLGSVDSSNASKSPKARSSSPGASSMFANENKALGDRRTSTTPTTSDLRTTISKLRINTTGGTSPTRVQSSPGQGGASPEGGNASLPSSNAAASAGTFKQKRGEKIVLDDENRAAKADTRARKHASAIADQRARVIVEPTMDVDKFIDVPSSFLSAFHEKTALTRAITEEKHQICDLLLILLRKKLLVLSCEPISTAPAPAASSSEKVTNEAVPSSPYLDTLGLSHGSKSEKIVRRDSTSIANNTAESAGAVSVKLGATGRRLNSSIGKGIGSGKFQLKNAVSGLIRKQSSAGAAGAAGAGKAALLKHGSGSSNGELKKQKKAEKKIEYGVILRNTQISSAMFVTCVVNEESWDIRVSRWMRPVTHWGKTAGPEPFWRRLEIEKKSKTGGGKYTKLNQMDSRVDKVAKSILYTLKLRQRTSAMAKEHLIEPVRMVIERDCMNWEDALGIAVRRKITQERLERRRRLAANKSKPDPQASVSLFTKLKNFFSRFAKIVPAGLYDPEAWHVKRLTRQPRNQREVVHLRRLRVESIVKRGETDCDTIYRHQILKAPTANSRNNVVNNNMIISSALAVKSSNAQAIKVTDHANNSNSHFLKKPMELTLSASLITEKSEWTRKTSWITGEEVNIDAKTGTHKTLTGGVVNSGSSQLHESDGTTATDAQGKTIKQSKYKVVAKFPEAWSCGGAMDGVVTVMRVVDQQDRIPRGGPVIEVVKGEGAAALRCGFQNKLILCDDNRNAFASHTYIRVKARSTDPTESFSRPGTANTATNFLQKRALSIDAAARQRHCYIPTSELPSSDAFYALMLRTVYDSRHSWAATRGYVQEIQQLRFGSASRKTTK